MRAHAAAAAIAAVAFSGCPASDDASSSTSSTAAQGAAGAGGLDAVGAGGFSTGGAADVCKVGPEGDALPPCDEQGPPDSFQPEVQWTWTVPPSPAQIAGSVVTPLVANLSDDNGDGAIDLCDVPDVLVVTMAGAPSPHEPGKIYLLAGDTGEQQLEFEGQVDGFITPALGDIDGDGIAEVVTTNTAGQLVAFEHDGSPKWTGDVGSWLSVFNLWCTAVSLYDLDSDGDVEIIAGYEVFDHQGKRLWGFSEIGNVLCATSTAADLDGDGMLEVIFGNGVFRHDGSPYATLPGSGGHPQVADLDDDGLPEILVTGFEGISVVEHDGALKFGPVRPTDPNPSMACWSKPAAIHDFDGDGVAQAAIGTCSDYSVYSIGPTATPMWSATVTDQSGLATGTAFDFLGDAVAEAIYADEYSAYIFDGADGELLLTTPRESGTFIEYPVVADVDNDGSAEIVIVSNWGWFGNPPGATVTVVKEAQDRWIQARRIWNQHAYHVTNVREDGTIPTPLPASWGKLNTFRTNGQIQGGQDCDPKLR